MSGIRPTLHADLSMFEKATDEEKRQVDRMRESTTFFRDGIGNLKRNKVTMASLAVFFAIFLIAMLAPPFYPYDYETTSANSASLTSTYQKPFSYSEKEEAAIAGGQSVFPHIFGTDELGRDYAARVIYGTRISLMVGIVAALIVVVIGIVFGSISGYFGGRVDLLMMRVVDIIYSLPDMLIIILLSVSLKDVLLNGPLSKTWLYRLGPGLVSIFIVFGLLYWVGMARLVRGQVLSIKEREFVLAAEASGASAAWIIRKHMIANSLSIIFISAALQVPSAIFTESYLSFLGLGVSIPMPSLGSLASSSVGQLTVRPYMILIPATAIFLIILSLNLIGNGLRDAFDPTQRERGR
ncbi:MAG: ABC transporter permease [Eubacteriaceae bacterium]|jgi:oligopeptide transport system permease protein|nr:ABC transporter permease [Eubacteriaceae bacterium]